MEKLNSVKVPLFKGPTVFLPYKIKVPFPLVIVPVVLPTYKEEFLTVIVPEVAPIVNEVAAPPIFNVVAVALKRVAVVVVVVISPPLTARSPAIVKVSVLLLYVRPASPPRLPLSLNCTCVSDPPGAAPIKVPEPSAAPMYILLFVVSTANSF